MAPSQLSWPALGLGLLDCIFLSPGGGVRGPVTAASEGTPPGCPSPTPPNFLGRVRRHGITQLEFIEDDSGTSLQRIIKSLFNYKWNVCAFPWSVPGAMEGET